MCFFINKHEFPQDSKVAYCYIVCNIRTHKKETHIVQITVGGKKLTYNVPVSIPAEYLTTARLYCKSILSNPDAKYLIVDVKNSHLNNPMKKNKYFKISINLIP